MKVLALFLLSISAIWADTCSAPCLVVVTSSSGASSPVDSQTGTLIVISCGHFAATCIAPTDNQMNSYTGLTNYVRSSNNLTIWYKCGPTTNAAHTFTPGQAGDTIAVTVYTGTATSSCLDAGQDVGTTTNCNPCNTSITPSVASSGYVVVSALSNCGLELPTVADDQGNTILVSTHISSTCGQENAWQAYRNYNSTSAIQISWSVVVDFAATASAGFLGPAAATYHGPNGGVFVTGP